MESLRKRLMRYINIQEAADYQVRLLHRPEDLTRHPLKEQGQGYTATSTIKALPADGSGKQRQRKKRCIYCEDEHWSDECLRYPNIEVRRNKLKNRCFIYLKENHKTRHCKLPAKPCVHCEENRKHLQSLCPNKFRMKSTIEDQERNDQPATSAKSGMVAMGEKVVMQTAVVSVV